MIFSFEKPEKTFTQSRDQEGVWEQQASTCYRDSKPATDNLDPHGRVADGSVGLFHAAVRRFHFSAPVGDEHRHVEGGSEHDKVKEPQLGFGSFASGGILVGSLDVPGLSRLGRLDGIAAIIDAVKGLGLATLSGAVVSDRLVVSASEELVCACRSRKGSPHERRCGDDDADGDRPSVGRITRYGPARVIGVALEGAPSEVDRVRGDNRSGQNRALDANELIERRRRRCRIWRNECDGGERLACCSRSCRT